MLIHADIHYVPLIPLCRRSITVYDSGRRPRDAAPGLNSKGYSFIRTD